MENSIQTRIKLKYYGAILEPKMFLLINDGEKKTRIAEIDNIILYNHEIFFIMIFFEIINFNQHYHAYQIKETSEKFLSDCESIFYYHPFNAYESRNKELLAKPPCIFDDSMN